MKKRDMEIKEALENLALSKDINGLRKYVKDHEAEIYEIYCKEGSGAKPLLSAYEKICMTEPRIAIEYQDIMETSIAGDVLFSNE